MPAESKRQVRRGIRTRRIPGVRGAIVGRVAVGRPQHALHDRARWKWHAAQHHRLRRIAAARLHGRFPAEGFLHAPVHGVGVEVADSQRRRVRQDCPEGVGDRGLGGFDATEEHDERVGGNFLVVQQPRMRPREGVQQRARRGVGGVQDRLQRGAKGEDGRLGTGTRLRVPRIVDQRVGERVVPLAQEPVPGRGQPQHARDGGDRDGRSVGGAQFRARGRECPDVRRDHVIHERRERAHGLGVERGRARRFEAPLRRALGREHLRPESLTDGGPGIVGAEAHGVAQHLPHEVTTGDQPLPDGWRPGHRFGGPQAMEDRIGIIGQLVDGDGGSDREGGGSGHVVGGCGRSRSAGGSGTPCRTGATRRGGV